MSPSQGSRLTTWGTVSSGFRESRSAGIGWNLWGMLPHLLPQEPLSQRVRNHVRACALVAFDDEAAGGFWEGARKSAGRLSEQPLDHDHISPSAVELAVAAVQADRVEAAAFGQPDARDVVGEELADHLVEAALFGHGG